MAETILPAAEALEDSYDERNSYEFAFHVLPTVAEGEVPSVFGEIKAHITGKGGEIFGEEAPERVDLAYEVVKSIEAKNRRFKSAYFGWVRFKMEGEKAVALIEELRNLVALLRSLTIKLTKIEEARPFRFHENRKSVKMVEVIDDEKLGVLREAPVEGEVAAVVSEAELDESLEKLTSETETEKI